jgi:hypothetical protein
VNSSTPTGGYSKHLHLDRRRWRPHTLPTRLPGSLPGLRSGTKAQPRASARGAPKMRPRASKPAAPREGKGRQSGWRVLGRWLIRVTGKQGC